MAKRTLTNEQILSRFGSIEAYDEHRLKVSIYRKKRRQSKKAKTEYEQIKSSIWADELSHPIKMKRSLLDWLGEPVCSKTECTRLGAIVLLFLATMTILTAE